MKPQLVSLDMLRKIFEEHAQENPVIMKRNCSECGCAIEIEIHKTSSGFGLQGGILLERNQQIVADCLKCYEKLTVELV